MEEREFKDAEMRGGGGGVASLLQTSTLPRLLPASQHCWTVETLGQKYLVSLVLSLNILTSLLMSEDCGGISLGAVLYLSRGS